MIEQSELNRLTNTLRELAANFQESIAPKVVPIEPTYDATPPEWRDYPTNRDSNPHRKALRDFAKEIGLERMQAAYDELVDRDGYIAVAGVNSAWDGVHDWRA